MNFGYLKVGAYTPKIKVADCKGNALAVISAITEAEEAGVKVLVFPQLCITSASCGDLFTRDVLLNGAGEALADIVSSTEGKDVLAFVGMPVPVGDYVYDCAVAVKNGEILGVVPKTNGWGKFASFIPEDACTIELAGFEVPFDAELLFCGEDVNNLCIGVEVGNDLFAPNAPSFNLARGGATLIVNLSAANELVGREKFLQTILSSHTARLKCGYVYANAGEGESTTDVVYGGGNAIYENGKMLAKSEIFSVGLTVSEIDLSFLVYERQNDKNYGFFNGDNQIVGISFETVKIELTRRYDRLPFIPCESEMDERARLILSMQAHALKKRIEHTRTSSLVIGVSGGLDSSLALLVAVEAAKLCGMNAKSVIAVTMPCFGTTKRTYDNSKALASCLGVTLKKVNISRAVKRHFADIGHSEAQYDTTYENAQARERTQVLMDIANMSGGMVVGTGDLSEIALGWATYNGDHMSMYSVNSSVPKTLIRHLISYYVRTENSKLGKVLADILETPVSPELLPAKDGEIDQKTEDIVGPYELHDFYLYHFIRNGFAPSKIYAIACKTFEGTYDKKTIYKWLKTFIRRFFVQQFKRTCVPDGVKIGTVALSPRGEWQMATDTNADLWIDELDQYVEEEK